MAENTEPVLESQEAEASFQPKVQFRIPVRFPSVYAHHMIVQESELEVVLSFFEILQPVIPMEEGEDRAKKLKQIQEAGIPAECVSRVTVAKARFPFFAEIIRTIADKIIKEFEEIEKEYAVNNPNDQQNS